jgi:uncharacterized membrane protein
MNETSRAARVGLALGLGALAGLAAVQMLRTKRRANADESQALDAYQTEAITINQPIERVYEAWRSLESVGFMSNAVIVDSRDQEMCAWTSTDGIAGVVTFVRAPGARGTEVHVELTRKAGVFGTGIARVLGMAPDQLVREDLRRFKQLLETGELTLSDGPGLWRAAQPPESAEQITAFSGVER